MFNKKLSHSTKLEIEFKRTQIEINEDLRSALAELEITVVALVHAVNRLNGHPPVARSLADATDELEEKR